MTMWKRSGDWMNTAVYTRAKVNILRIDILLALGFLGCVAYYSTFSWMHALAGGLFYIMMIMISIWLL